MLKNERVGRLTVVEPDHIGEITKEGPGRREDSHDHCRTCQPEIMAMEKNEGRMDVPPYTSMALTPILNRR